MARKLTNSQRDALEMLARFNGGHWWLGCGWKWDTPSGTVRKLEALARHGFAEEIHDRFGERHFAITEAGRTELAARGRKPYTA